MRRIIYFVTSVMFLCGCTTFGGDNTLDASLQDGSVHQGMTLHQLEIVIDKKPSCGFWDYCQNIHKKDGDHFYWVVGNLRVSGQHYFQFKNDQLIAWGSI